MVEAATLGMPFEVWKTRMGRHRNETTMQAFRGVIERSGVRGFWQGLTPKMIEAGSKGAVLLYSKDIINDAMMRVQDSQTAAGFVAGAGGGVAQTVVMGPCTFLVTSVVTGDKNESVNAKIHRTYAARGIRGFYPGGTAIAFRQATNWASRQGLTEFFRQTMLTNFHSDEEKPKLSVGEEVLSGLIGGALSCWNQPFEVARIEMQANADQAGVKRNMWQVMKHVHAEYGMAGLFKGVLPRMGLGMYQTLFMVTGAKLLREWMNPEESQA